MQLPSTFSSPLAGRYQVESQVGEGASGVVYRAVDLHGGRPVALKLMRPVDGVRDNPALREAALLAHLEHPGIIRILDAGLLEDLALPYLVMEWIDGQSLAMHHEIAPLSVRQSTALGILLARALSQAHQAGIVHRDIKPENILLRRSLSPASLVPDLDVEPVLVDFGIATTTGSAVFAGTPAYMSPEQARGDSHVDHRSDLYSLGATLFELYVGHPPHRGASPIATLARLATTPAPRMSNYRPDLPGVLDDAIDSMLQTDPDRRPESATWIAHALSESLEAELPPQPEEPDLSSGLGSGATRLVTTLVAEGFSSSQGRDKALRQLRDSGAHAVPLGANAVVAHLGVERATGAEARVALDLGSRLARAEARVGVASGRARLALGRGHETAHPVGEVVDRAATLARAASAGQLISDATTSELGRGRYEFRARDDGSTIVAGRVRGPARDRSGGAPFVGREAELAQILAAHDRARDSNHSMAITVTGPPGIGKSRLQKEAVARISARANATLIVVQRSDAYGQKHVLGAAADVLRSILGLSKAVKPEQAERAINERLGPQTLSQLSRDNTLLLSRLLSGRALPEGLDAEGSRDALWLAMTDLVHRVLSEEPMLLVVEDLQWADRESVAWLDHLLGRSTSHPLILLACVRPSFWEEHGTPFSHRDHVGISLHPVSSKAVRAIAASMLGEDAREESLADIAAQAGGSPLFAEELARLAASGRDARSAPTIEAAIQVSLDTLDTRCRDALGRLSVLGQACWAQALTALGMAGDSDVTRALSAQEVLIEQSTSRFPETNEYLFKHALVRDVAYQSLDTEHRAELHALAGRWLAEVGEDAATVAGHLDLGGKHAEASQFWEQAAQRALTANAISDALAMAEKALTYAEDAETAFRRASYLDEAWSRMDPRAADRETAIEAMESNAHDEASRTRAHGARARFDDARGMGSNVSERLSEVRAAAERQELHDEVGRCAAALATRAAFAGDFVTAEREAHRLLELPRNAARGARVDAYQTLAIIRQARGAVSTALEERRRAVSAAREAGLKEREAMLMTNLGFALSSIGARQEARDALESGLLLAEHIGSRGAARHAQMNLLGWASLYGNDRKLEAYLSETREEADAAATGYWAAPDRSNLGILFYRGAELLRSPKDSARARALILLRMAAARYRELQHLDVLPVALGMWAEAERLCGNPTEAARIGQEAAELLDRGAPSLLNEAPVFLTLYKARLELGNHDAAREALASSVGPLLRRLNGLIDSPYARTFLTELPHNAELVAAADAAGLLPDRVHRLLAGGRDA